MALDGERVCQAANDDPAASPGFDGSEVGAFGYRQGWTSDDLARILRQLRRRHARARSDRVMTYRQMVVKTGWSLGIISDYFSGKVLPPVDRFDLLTALLGATPAERGWLATVRDEIEERRAGGDGPRPAVVGSRSAAALWPAW